MAAFLSACFSSTVARRIPLATAVAMASTTPAQIIGLGGRKGSLVAGADADLLVLGPDLEVRAVYQAGDQVAEAAGRSVR